MSVGQRKYILGGYPTRVETMIFRNPVPCLVFFFTELTTNDSRHFYMGVYLRGYETAVFRCLITNNLLEIYLPSVSTINSLSIPRSKIELPSWTQWQVKKKPENEVGTWKGQRYCSSVLPVIFRMVAPRSSIIESGET